MSNISNNIPLAEVQQSQSATARTDLRLALYRNGYRPIPVSAWNAGDVPPKDRGKNPNIKGWARFCSDPAKAENEIREWERLRQELTNTGILCAGLRAIDLDIESPEIVAEIEAYLEVMLGMAPRRFRSNSSRCLLVYRAAEGEPPKRTIVGTDKTKVEVLGEGQQFVAYGQHHTGATLEWGSQSPLNVPMSALPSMTEEDITNLLAFAAPLMGSPGEQAATASRRRSSTTLSQRADNPEDAIAALKAIPNNEPANWTWWKEKIGMAFFAAVGGIEEGKAAFHEWSALNAAYDEGATDRAWTEMRRSPPTRTGAEPLFAFAARHGFQKPKPEWGSRVVLPKTDGQRVAGSLFNTVQPGTQPACAESRAQALSTLKKQLTYSGKELETTHANLQLILTGDPDLAGLFWRDEFRQADMIMGAVPSWNESLPAPTGPFPRAITDRDTLHLLGYVQRHWAGGFGRTVLEDSLQVAAGARTFHPVRDGLAGLVWDGEPRLESWLAQVFDCDDTPYHRAVASKLLIAAVRRVRQPGCKFDFLPVLAGAQGILKSTALRTLFFPEWFTDSLPADLGHKDAAIALAGVWAVELAEIDQLIRAEAETIKAFLSRQVDRYRPPYGRRSVEVPRQCVLIGTTNSDGYLRDSTGNRRIWPVHCPRRGNLDWLEVNREQLWAEACHAEANGATIWLDDPAVAAVAAEAAREKLAVDPWADRVARHVLDKDFVTVPDILENVLHVPTAQLDKRTEMRVSNILRAEGWTSVRRQVGGLQVRGWAR